MTMSIEDRLAIQEVIARYSYAYDSQNPEAFAQLFVENAVFEIFVPGRAGPALHLGSRAAIREWADRRLHERRDRFSSRHYQSGILFDELTRDSARTRTMVLVTHQERAGSAPRPTASGVYHDQWRRTEAGWRLAHRAAHVDGALDLAPARRSASANTRKRGVQSRPRGPGSQRTVGRRRGRR